MDLLVCAKAVFVWLSRQGAQQDAYSATLHGAEHPAVLGVSRGYPKLAASRGASKETIAEGKQVLRGMSRTRVD